MPRKGENIYKRKDGRWEGRYIKNRDIKYYFLRKQAEKLLYKEEPTQGERIYSSKGPSCTLTSGSGGFGGHSELYLIENVENFDLPIKSKAKDGYQIAYPGDSIDTAFL